MKEDRYQLWKEAADALVSEGLEVTRKRVIDRVGGSARDWKAFMDQYTGKTPDNPRSVVKSPADECWPEPDTLKPPAVVLDIEDDSQFEKFLYEDD